MHVCPECGETRETPGECARDGTLLAPAPEGEPLLGQMVGSWRIARLLGAGGMGRVYKAVQPSIGGRVAIKVLTRECAEDRDLVERFFAEARAVNLIRHEHIVHVLDLAFLSDGRPYIVMDFIDGAPLSAVIARQGPLPLGGLLHLVVEVLGAIGAAHARGIVHRDLKPDNVFVTPAGHARVLDFGIAKLAPDLAKRSGPTRSGMLLGTPTYMSPEQAAGRPVDARTDLYAIGVMLYEGATGAVPFDSPVLYELLRQHIEEPPPSPRTRRVEIPLELEAIMLRALEKQPDRRYANAAEMAAALRKVIDRLPDSEQRELSPAGAVALPAGVQAASDVPATRIAQSDKAFATTALDSGPRVSAAKGAAGEGALTTERTARPRKAWIVAGGAVAMAGVGFAIVMWRAGAGSRPGETLAAPAIDAGATTETRVAELPAPLPPPPSTTPSPTPPPASPAPAAPVAAPKRARSRPDAGVSTHAATKENDPLSTEGLVGEAGSVLPRHFQLEVPSPTAFDAAAYYPKALAAARKIADDAQLTYLYVDKTKLGGVTDLTVGGVAFFTFRSKARSNDPPARCMVNITVVAHTIQVAEGANDECDAPLLGAPRCSPAEIWKRALADGAPDKGVASISFLWWQGKKVWHFKLKDFFHPYDDDC